MTSLGRRLHVRRLNAVEMRALIRAYDVLTPIVSRLHQLPELEDGAGER